MSENKTQNKPEDSSANSVGFSELLAPLNNLVEQWEWRVKQCQEMLKATESIKARNRLRVKESVIRSMVVELKREIKNLS